MTDPNRPVRAGLAWRWLFVRLLLVIPVLQLVVSLRGIAAPTESDYTILYVHAEMARSGEPLYWDWPDYGPHYGTDGLRFPQDRVFYPPFLTPILSAVTRWGLPFFAYLWTVLLWAAYWGYSALLAKLATGRITFLATIGWGVALFLLTGRAAQAAINLGNVDPLLWVAFGAALAYPALRGVGFMAIALVKLWGVWPLLFATLRGEKRTVWTAVATLIAGTVLSAVVLGMSGFTNETMAWIEHMLPVAGQGTFNAYNISIPFALLRAAQYFGWEYVSGPLPLDARLFLTTVGVVAPLLAGWATRHSEARIQYAFVGCAAVFFSPLAWSFYTPILLAPLAILIRRHNQGALDRDLRTPVILPPSPEEARAARWGSQRTPRGDSLPTYRPGSYTRR
jgi:hypothetical protein